MLSRLARPAAALRRGLATTAQVRPAAGALRLRGALPCGGLQRRGSAGLGSGEPGRCRAAGRCQPAWGARPRAASLPDGV